MKILVVDDQRQQRENALALLKNHDVTTTSGWEASCRLLLSEKKEKNPNGFDVVLTDLMMPAEAKGLTSDHCGELTPYGLTIALFAMRCGVENVAIVSNSNHHHDPILWSIDALYGRNLNGRLRVFSGNRCPNMGGNLSHLKDWRKVLNIILSEDPGEWELYEEGWERMIRGSGLVNLKSE